MNLETRLSVVVVEDEPELCENLVFGLASHDLEVRGVGDGAQLDRALALKPAHIVVLDLGLPGEDGLAIAERLGDDPSLGIVMLTARGLTRDRILGLESGADNYFVKPVNIAELAAAIKNLGRRLAPKSAASPWSFHAGQSRLFTPNSIGVALTAQECILLELLFARLGESVSRREIFTALGQPDDLCSNARIEVLISRLRSKVRKADPAAPMPLRARHSLGYVFLAEGGQ